MGARHNSGPTPTISRIDVFSWNLPALGSPRGRLAVLAGAGGGRLGRTHAPPTHAARPLAMGQAGPFHRLFWADAALDPGLGAAPLPGLGVFGHGGAGEW